MNMDDDDRRINKKRKISGPEEDTDDLLELSLSLKSFDPPPDPSSSPPPQPQTPSPVCRLTSTNETLNSPRLSPQPPPASPQLMLVYWPIFPSPNLSQPLHYPQPSPSPPLPSSPSLPIRQHVYPTTTLNSPILYAPQPPSPSTPVLRRFFPTEPINSPRLSPQPASSPPRPPPSLSVSQLIYPTTTLNSPILYTPQPPSPSTPVLRHFFPTEPINSPRLSPQPSSSPPRPPPSLSVSQLIYPTATKNSQESSQEPSGDRDGHPRPPRPRRNPYQLPREGKSLEIVPPYPWATNRRCTVHSLQHLLSIHVDTITGEVQCKKCKRQYEMRFDLQQKLFEIFQFTVKNKDQMHDLAPSAWMHPSFPPCRFCVKENCLIPIISDKKRTVNWLFLLLGQMLGWCSLVQLKYFCKHTNNHRTGLKDRLLYLTYMGLCKQLYPNGPFDP